MRPTKITFKQLRDQLSQRAGQAEMPGESSVPNLTSALRQFMGERGHDWGDVVGSAFRRDFRRQRDAHLDALVAAGRDVRYVSNRRNYLGVWHGMLRTLEYEAAALDGTTTDLQDALQEIAKAHSASELAKMSGLTPQMLRVWREGSVPSPSKAPALRRLEIGLQLEEGALTDLLPRRSRGDLRSSSDVPATGYRKRLRDLRAKKFRLKPAEVTAAVPLRQEIPQLIAHKTGRTDVSTDSNSLYRAAKIQAETSNGERWRLKPLTACDRLVERGTMSEPRWIDVMGDRKCPSAATAFNHISDFFGWLRLPTAAGGRAEALESFTLGMLTDTELVDAFLDWRIQRSGLIHHGVMNWLGFAKSLCRAGTGFLPRHPALGAHFGIQDADAWRARCAAAHEFFAATQAALRPKVRHSRDPRETLKANLETECPVADYVSGLQRMQKMKPGAGGRNEAIWGRDVLLLALVISNPLRETNLRELTYRLDNSGQLRRAADGWKIRIEPTCFKNERFFKTAAEGVYEQDVHPKVASAIEKYLKIYRPMLLGGRETDILFVSSQGNPYRDGQLSQRFSAVTRRWVPKCPGVGLQSMRHIIASTIILRTRGDYILAAKYLHDKPETVAKFYAHILERVADRGRAGVLGDIFD